MQNRNSLAASLAGIFLGALLLSSGPALAQGHGGGGAHFTGGSAHGYGGWHGGYAGGWHGGYAGGWHGGYGYGGWHGGYGWGWHGGYYGWGWGGGLALGLYFAALPAYYSTLWWDGVPYYYADDTYYRYDTGAGQYETVAPPPEVQSQAAGQQTAGTDLVVYPKNGQSTEQLAKDKYDCHHWATTQSGFDPTQGATASASAAKRSDYMRAQAACLEGRGYSVK